MVSGWEKAPQYGGPPPSWKELVWWIVVIAIVGGGLYGLNYLVQGIFGT